MDDRLAMQERPGPNLPPHAEKDRPCYVTMRLADSLPAAVVEEYRADLLRRVEAQQRSLSRALSEDERAEIRQRASLRVERYLDAGHGACSLLQPEAAEVVQRVFQLHAGDRYLLDAWCVMPNHAHAIMTPRGGWTLEKISYDWRHGSSRLINHILRCRGMLWQTEAFDHHIRTDANLEGFRKYILNNPHSAGLRDWPYVGIG